MFRQTLRHSLFLLCVLAGPLAGQNIPTIAVDSIGVQGNERLTAAQITGTAGIVTGVPINYRDIQRAIINLMRTGQFDDIRVEQHGTSTVILVFVVTERPILERWAIEGNVKVSTRSIRDKVPLRDGRPIDRNGVRQGLQGIDSLYAQKGYYAASVVAREVSPAPGVVHVIYEVVEGERVAISQIVVNGNERFDDKEVVDRMATGPEGFWWFQPGDYDEDKLDRDLRDRLPQFYAEHGMVDFRVLSDTLIPDPGSGKATLHLTVEEGDVYQVGTFRLTGNRRFSPEELARFYPFGGPNALLPGPSPVPIEFDRSAWEKGTEDVSSIYANNGYIYAQVTPRETRRVAEDGTRYIDLSWTVQEGQPATINKILIVGNDVTHEQVIRRTITMVPGQLFSREQLINSYRSIENLGFFQSPMPPPDVQPVNGTGPDVDVIFRVEEKRTGNINFGASVGQGTGLGGFLGLEEPNLFGRGKRGRLQWQFGRNINDFTLSYSDPAIKESRISGTVTLFNSRARFQVGDLGTRRAEGGQVQVGFPLLGARFTRGFVSYGLQRIRYTGGSVDLRDRFSCSNCTRSTLGFSVIRDTRVGLPFPLAGMQLSGRLEFNGGILGGTGDYTKTEFEGRWYTPLGVIGGQGEFGGGMGLVLGVTSRIGFIFGDPGPFFTEMYSMGGVQFGLPLRGYDEFTITPNGYDTFASGGRASPDAFGQSYASFSAELGLRISASLYVNTFVDAGNVYRTPAQWDPTTLFRGAGVGAAFISPLGPLGLDFAYGFDRRSIFGAPAPAWKLHFKLGNFF
jgi:outer membrane protein insertion porin family